MPDRRTYGDSCGIARALDLAGERWALLIVRELVLGPKRFTDLRAGLPGVSTDVLAQRLRELEGAGLVTRRKLPPPAAARVYALTARGAELEPVLLALGRWGSRVPLPPASTALSPDALAIALKTMFVGPGAAHGERRYQLLLGEHAFAIHVGASGLDIERGELASPMTTITTDPATLTGLLWHGRALEAALAQGLIEIDGPRSEAVYFLTLFGAGTPPGPPGQ
ncbi:MAG: winged helix-turn-helix transcriptional regulator [Solirubrobacteraceae bacterium]